MVARVKFNMSRDVESRVKRTVHTRSRASGRTAAGVATGRIWVDRVEYGTKNGVEADILSLMRAHRCKSLQRSS